jgi:hypothetical protein
MGRPNGWKPKGTILDVEFQLDLELSYCQEPDAVNLDAFRKRNRGKVHTMARGDI